MTEHEKRMIEEYIPSPPDKALEWEEFYVMDVWDRVQKGCANQIGFDRYGNEIRQIVNGRGIINAISTDNCGWTRMKDLYDNKEDCKNQTHFSYDNWQELRELQEKENEH